MTRIFYGDCKIVEQQPWTISFPSDPFANLKSFNQ